jgi:hypothetical protein
VDLDGGNVKLPLQPSALADLITKDLAHSLHELNMEGKALVDSKEGH